MPLENTQQYLFQRVAALTQQAMHKEALQLLRETLRTGSLNPEGYEKAGRMLGRLRTSKNPADIAVTLLGQCTTSGLANMLTAVAWGRGCSLEIRRGEYDNVVQELMEPVAQEAKSQVVVLLPWSERLLNRGSHRSLQQRVDDEFRFWTATWDLLARQTPARIIQVGYDWMNVGPLGSHLGGGTEGEVRAVRSINERLREALPRGSFFLDLEQVSGIIGRDRFYDPRRYFWMKQPFSDAGVSHLAEHLWAGIRALTTGPKKVLVVDLDNTLWGGVIGEVGPLGIEIGQTGPRGEAFRSFQQYLKGLSSRGIILAICSKNNREDAISAFQQNPEMILSLGDFAHVEVGWGRKSIGLRRTAEVLNLGLDSFVFFDDSPAEREEVRTSLPEVEVADVPANPEGYIRALEAGLWFEAAALSEADFQRSNQYRQEQQRRAVRGTFSSMDDYLRSLDMCASVGSIDASCMPRVVQLLAKTNQFNLTTRRHSAQDVEWMLKQPGSVGMILSLRDKFGDHGIVSVLIAVPGPPSSEKTLRIETWLMSCRVIGRTAEQFLFNELLSRAGQLGYEKLTGEFIPSRKNAPVSDLFDRLKFQRIEEAADGTVTYQLYLNRARQAITFVTSNLTTSASDFASDVAGKTFSGRLAL